MPTRSRSRKSANRPPDENPPDENPPDEKPSCRERRPFAPVLILGIDPGSRFTGWGVVRQGGGGEHWIADGRLRTSPGLAVPRRLAQLARDVSCLADSWRPDVAAVESPYYGRKGANPRSLIVLAQARGAILAALAARELEVLEYSPAEVKTAIGGSGRAGKDDVARMVSLLLGLPDSGRSPDASDALAVALCCARRYRRDRLETTGSG